MIAKGLSLIIQKKVSCCYTAVSKYLLFRMHSHSHVHMCTHRFTHTNTHKQTHLQLFLLSVSVIQQKEELSVGSVPVFISFHSQYNEIPWPKATLGGKGLHGLQFTVRHQSNLASPAPSREVKQGLITEAWSRNHGRTLITCLLLWLTQLSFYITQAHTPRDTVVQSELDPSTTITNEENVTHLCTQKNPA